MDADHLCTGGIAQMHHQLGQGLGSTVVSDPPGTTTLTAIPTAPVARPQSPRSHGDGEPRQDRAPAASGRKMQQILAVMAVSASRFLLKRV